MFGTNNHTKANTGIIETIIGEQTVMEGAIHVEGTLRVDGTLKGEAFANGSVIIGKDAFVEGSITAASVLIAGRVKGNLFVKEKTELTKISTVEGDITTKILNISEGAAFKGSCFMVTSEMPAKNPQLENSVSPVLIEGAQPQM